MCCTVREVRLILFERVLFCSSKKEGIGNSKGVGVLNSIFLKESTKQNWNFQRGGVGGQNQKEPSVGGVWIFSGTTHC